VPRTIPIESVVEKILQELRPPMTRLVVGDISLSIWCPSPGSMDIEMVKHIEALRIPYIKGKPNVLLHDLGSFKDDPVIAGRLKNIFMPNNHTFVPSYCISPQDASSSDVYFQFSCQYIWFG
jgi:hypothetical protein